MSEYKRPPKSILRRRQSVSADVEAFLDGLAVAILGYVLTVHYVGTPRLIDLLALLSLLAAMTVSYDGLGIYRRHGELLSKTLRLARAWFLSFAIVVVISYATGVLGHFNRDHMAIFFVTSFIAQLLLHLGAELLQRKRLNGTTKGAALIVGGGQLAEYISERINANPWIAETVIGFISVPSGDHYAEEGYRAKLPVLGTLDDIGSVLAANEINSVYIVTAPGASPIAEKTYFTLLDNSIDIHWVPNVFALPLINFNVKELAGIPVITLSESPLSGRALLIKNVEDKLIASLALLLVSPIMAIAAIAIKLGSPGPVLFFQERNGWDGKVFSIWKFRSMYIHTPKDGIVKQATSDDPRVTPIGRVLRRTSIDELPQLFNVILGNMSLVGPRPHAIQHNNLYSRKIHAYLSRHRIKPGITGLAQVRGYRGETQDLRLMEERVKHDVEYINNWSLFLDLSILFRTVFSLFSTRAY